MNANTVSAKFPPVLCNALQEGRVVFPELIRYLYSPVQVYRGVVINLKKTTLEESDFYSQIERKLPGYSENDIENYSCSVFHNKKSLELAFKLPRKGKKIASGMLMPEYGPCIFEAGNSHIHWFRFASSHPEQFFEVLQNETE